MKPMLAKKYADHSHKLEYPLYVQPKLNGVRALYHNGDFQSRDEHMWNPPVLEHLTTELANIPLNLILDGELYVHGWPLQKINGAASVNRLLPTTSTTLIQYHVFDCFDANNFNRPFSDRIRLLYSLPTFQTSLFSLLVNTHEVYSPAEADHFYRHFKDLEYEGMMYRTDSPYGLASNCTNKENRWPCLLKRKEWLDEDCEIIDVEIGEGKYSSCVGSLTLRFPNGRIFSAGSGLSDLQRLTYMDAPPIGRFAKIKYEMLSIDGVPLKPTVEAVLD